ncbi:TlpA family protein disulfide reductase [Variovorax sp. VNK109]|jgi:thiol-disulfide isomerase/thioredoxin|uniref:TlpA family protein disulfide reductase n=1 Tax=Variovorax sp. VNK109 TaxID=3400919 RepID=UPI003C06895F
MSDKKEKMTANDDVRSLPQAGRRNWLVTGVGAAAVLAGAGFGWWRLQPHGLPGDEVPQLWGLKFDKPGGGELAMASFRGKPLIVNFWATWCPPCVEELPMLERFFQQNVSNGWQVVGLAIDQPSAVAKFLQRMPLTFPMGLAGMDGTDLGKSLGNLTGGLPFTVMIDPAGRVIKRKMGKLEPVDLTELVSGNA